MCVTQLVGGVFLKSSKYFEVMLNILEFSGVSEIVEPWLVYANKSYELRNHISWPK